MSKARDLKRSLKKLLKVATKSPELLKVGVCSSIHDYMPASRKLAAIFFRREFEYYCMEELHKHFVTWSHYSGDIIYPVPAEFRMSNESARFAYTETRHSRWEGFSLVMRISLIKHLIDRLG